MPMEIFDAPPADVQRDAPAKTTETPTGNPGGLKGRVMERGAESAKDILGLPSRVLRLMTGKDKPQSAEDYALIIAASAPAIMAGGAGAGAVVPQLPRLAPALGRVASSVALAKGRGESNTAAAIEGAGAGMMEGAGALATKMLGSSSRAVDAIRERIGRGPDGPLNLRLFESLMEWWKADPSKAVRSQRARGVARQLRDLDPSGEAASMFKDEVVKGTKIPFSHKTLPAVSPDASRRAVAATGPAGSSVADAAISSHPAAPILATSPMATVAARLVPHGVRPHFIDAIAEGE